MFVYYLMNPGEDDGDDAPRVRALPESLRAELLHYATYPWEFADGIPELPCLWLDPVTRKCRHYEHRPSICRDALERGDEGCRLWRDQYAEQITEAAH